MTKSDVSKSIQSLVRNIPINIGKNAVTFTVVKKTISLKNYLKNTNYIYVNQK